MDSYLTTIRTSAELSFYITKPPSDSLGSTRRLASASMSPKSDWFALKLENCDSVHIHLDEWLTIKQYIEALIEASQKPVNIP